MASLKSLKPLILFGGLAQSKEREGNKQINGQNEKLRCILILNYKMDVNRP